MKKRANRTDIVGTIFCMQQFDNGSVQYTVTMLLPVTCHEFFY